MKHPAAAPESFRFCKQMPLMRRDVNRNPLFHRPPIALTLVAMVMRVENRIDFCHADLPQQLQYVPRTEINQQGAVTILNDVNIASVT